jgi:hypothetical protein
MDNTIGEGAETGLPTNQFSLPVLLVREVQQVDEFFFLLELPLLLSRL